ncbi:hypothetical protein [Emticicia fluvialis]|uniref:hypothetical protein n=1 Tax=Emticicia fluvialis TaxID=2974474 RepID=UPI002165B0DF|nr:hypothetical protein [Emticicia fluvialis]
MKAISIWASQNQKTAILLIIIFEVLKCSIGFDIGHHFLPVFSSWAIELSVLGLVFLTTFVQTSYQHQTGTLNKEAHRKFRLMSTGAIMASSLFLSILLGNHLKGLGYQVHSIYVANAAERVTTTATENNKKNGAPIKVTEKKTRKGFVSRLLSKKTVSEDPKSNSRITYALLFFLSLLLTFAGLILTCQLACGGFSLLAILAFLVSLGVLSGGLYFLIRAFKKDLKPFQSLTQKEKKKEQLKFFVIWILLGAAIALIALLS